MFSTNRVLLFPNHITSLIERLHITNSVSVFFNFNITLNIRQHILLIEFFLYRFCFAVI